MIVVGGRAWLHRITERLATLKERFDATIIPVEDPAQPDGSRQRIQIIGGTEIERLIAALEKRIDKLIVRVEERPPPAEVATLSKRRLDNLSRIEVEQIVAAEGKRLYGSDWLKITERR